MTGLAVITGGTRGIGYATAARFARQRRPLVLSYRRDDRAAAASAHQLRSMGVEVVTVRADLAEDASPLVSAVLETGIAVDVLVLNAAASAFRPLSEIRAHHVAKTLGITIGSLLEVTNGLSPAMSYGSNIVTVSGGDSVRYIPGHGLLGGAKAAIETLTKYLAVELASRGIRANCVLPGPIATDSATTWAGAGYADFLARVEEATPAGRIGVPDDVAAVIDLLCDPRAAWINGQVITVDGGMFFGDRIFTGSPASNETDR